MYLAGGEEKLVPLVPLEGLEPPLLERNTILSRTRLPFRHRGCLRVTLSSKSLSIKQELGIAIRVQYDEV